MARYGAAQSRARCSPDPGIVRNRLKIEAAVQQRAGLPGGAARSSAASTRYLWGFVDGHPRVNRWTRPSEVPATTPQSDAMSRD